MLKGKSEPYSKWKNANHWDSTKYIIFKSLIFLFRTKRLTKISQITQKFRFFPNNKGKQNKTKKISSQPINQEYFSEKLLVFPVQEKVKALKSMCSRMWADASPFFCQRTKLSLLLKQTQSCSIGSRTLSRTVLENWLGRVCKESPWVNKQSKNVCCSS